VLDLRRMFGLGMGEILMVLLVALLVLGPEKLPDAARTIGKGLRDLRRHTRDIEDTIAKDEQLGGAVRDLKGMLTDTPAPAPRPRPAAPAAPAPDASDDPGPPYDQLLDQAPPRETTSTRPAGPQPPAKKKD
jgi:sec-independent protein translocase protein TatB